MLHVRIAWVRFRLATQAWPARISACVIPLLCLTGCEPKHPDADGSTSVFTRKDSAGIAICTTSGDVAKMDLGWDVGSQPDLVIGAGDSMYLFRVQGIKGSSDGGVVAVDAGSQELRFFDRQGNLVQRAGRNGEGPGEFRDPVLVPWPGQDSLLVFDRGLVRLQVFSSDGTYTRGIRLSRAWMHGRLSPLGANGSLGLLLEPSSIVGGERALQSDGLIQIARRFVWLDPIGVRELLLDTFVVDLTFRDGESYLDIPFAARPAAIVTDTGVLVTDGRIPEIREYGRSGVLRRILRVDIPRSEVTTEMVLTVAGEKGLRLPVPDSLPFFDVLLRDDKGWVWAGMYNWNTRNAKNWIVFDPDGEAKGIVRTPAEFDVQSIGEGMIWGTSRDKFGVEYIGRYGIVRGSNGAGTLNPQKEPGLR